MDPVKHLGRQTLQYDGVYITAHSALAGQKEAQGPLKDFFDILLEDDLLGTGSWEQAESEMQRRTLHHALAQADLSAERLQILLGGDLNAQIIASTFAARSIGAPFIGLYGACSTFVQAILLGSALISGGFAENAACMASSHFCTAERQFRSPLELGTQRPPQASWTATACGCALLEDTPRSSRLRVTYGTLGRIVDLNITDANHMGAAMAPAVYDTIAAHFADTGRCADDYDLIATGDLGWIGREILLELFARGNIPMPDDKLIDCGASLFYQEQDAHAGGSGCGCVASVASGMLFKKIESGMLHRVLIAGSGAMMSPVSSQQKQSIPGISYAVSIEEVRR